MGNNELTMLWYFQDLYGKYIKQVKAAIKKKTVKFREMLKATTKISLVVMLKYSLFTVNVSYNRHCFRTFSS